MTTVTISQAYAAAIEDVWDACTSAERIPRWFLPVSGELKPGGGGEAGARAMAGRTIAAYTATPG